MTYRRWMTARQLLAEEFVGVYQRGAKRVEDEQFQRSLKAARPTR
jgi:hypothetical protein